jgi:hypothetical protein
MASKLAFRRDFGHPHAADDVRIIDTGSTFSAVDSFALWRRFRTDKLRGANGKPILPVTELETRQGFSLKSAPGLLEWKLSLGL